MSINWQYVLFFMIFLSLALSIFATVMIYMQQSTATTDKRVEVVIDSTPQQVHVSLPEGNIVDLKVTHLPSTTHINVPVTRTKTGMSLGFNSLSDIVAGPYVNAYEAVLSGIGYTIVDPNYGLVFQLTSQPDVIPTRITNQYTSGLDKCYLQYIPGLPDVIIVWVYTPRRATWAAYDTTPIMTATKIHEYTDVHELTIYSSSKKAMIFQKNDENIYYIKVSKEIVHSITKDRVLDIYQYKDHIVFLHADSSLTSYTYDADVLKDSVTYKKALNIYNVADAFLLQHDNQLHVIWIDTNTKIYAYINVATLKIQDTKSVVNSIYPIARDTGAVIITKPDLNKYVTFINNQYDIGNTCMFENPVESLLSSDEQNNRPRTTGDAIYTDARTGNSYMFNTGLLQNRQQHFMVRYTIQSSTTSS